MRVPFKAAVAALVLVAGAAAFTVARSSADTTPAPVFAKATCTASTLSCTNKRVGAIEQFLGSVYPPPPSSQPAGVDHATGQYNAARILRARRHRPSTAPPPTTTAPSRLLV